MKRPCPFCDGEINVEYRPHQKKMGVAACLITHAGKTCKRWERAQQPSPPERDRRKLLREADRWTDEARETLKETRKPN